MDFLRGAGDTEISNSLPHSLSLSNTHTHTHTQSLTQSLSLALTFTRFLSLALTCTGLWGVVVVDPVRNSLVVTADQINSISGEPPNFRCTHARTHARVSTQSCSPTHLHLHLWRAS